MLTLKGILLASCSLIMISLGFLFLDRVLITLGILGIGALFSFYYLSRANIRDIAVDITPPSHAYAHVPFPIETTFENQKNKQDSFNLKIELHLSLRAKIFQKIDYLEKSASTQSSLKGSLSQRGHHQKHSYKISSTFPGGCFKRESRQSVNASILVYPEPLLPKGINLHGELMDILTSRFYQTQDTNGEFRNLRDWKPGDPAKKIHWPSSARTLARQRGLRVREDEPLGFQPQACQIIFHSHSRPGSMIRRDRFEKSLSLLCGTMRLLCRQKLAFTLHADFLGWSPVTCRHQSELGEVLTLLAEAQRALSTEAHEWTSLLETMNEKETCFLFSDSPPHEWVDFAPSSTAHLIAVDVSHSKAYLL